MKVQSTGLGKTVMKAQFKGLAKSDFEGQASLLLTMESSEPLHWTIKVYLDPRDVRRAVVMGLKPSVLWRAFVSLVCGRFSFLKRARPRTATETGSPPETAGLPAPGPDGSDSRPSGLSVLAKFKE
ncbi:MAG: hypothetical protein KJ621_06405 [Proteobacteria bacterium]|nr:hypothetical protein [Pseudomonadota bacterium]MBU1742400.1 hypothetical protein [Pseudomonadota bacterium]